MKNTWRRLLSAFMAVVLVLSLAPVSVFAATSTTTNVSYIDANGSSQTADNATVVESDTTTWTNGWYVVQGDVTVSDRITVSGSVHLILADGCHLNASSGIEVSGENSLTIYAQSTGDNMGAMTSEGNTINNAGSAGIGGTAGGDQKAGGSITINGGNITARGGMGYGGSNKVRNSGAGIGGACSGTSGTIVINGGIVDSRGRNYGGAGIGSGESAIVDTITINGGVVTAIGGYGGAGIGSGWQNGDEQTTINDNSIITVNGGIVNATGGTGGADIGNGRSNVGCVVNINGGSVTANGGAVGAGIGAGFKSAGCNVMISGGDVTANGGTNTEKNDYGGGIDTASGSGNEGDNGSFIATGNAVIKASTSSSQKTLISSETNQANWQGVIFENNAGTVYGSPTITGTAIIPENATLTIPDGATLTIGAGGELVNKGTITVTSGGGLKVDGGKFYGSAATGEGTAATPTAPLYGDFLVTATDGGSISGASGTTVPSDGSKDFYYHTGENTLYILKDTELTLSTPGCTAANPGSTAIEVTGSIEGGAKLTLSGVHISTSAVHAIDAASALNLTLAEGSTNTLTATGYNQHGIWGLGGDIAIDGAGTVTAEGYIQGIYGVTVTIGSETGKPNVTATGKADGIRGRDGVTINSGTVTATGGTNGIYGTSVTINGGTVEATGTSGAGISGTSVTINDGTVTAEGTSNDGILASSVTIKGGTVTATSTSGDGIFGKDGVTIESGAVNATGGTHGISGNSSVTISGGTVIAEGSTYGISGNSSVTISGGTVNAEGTNDYGIEGATVTIESGVVEATGGNTGISGTFSTGESGSAFIVASSIGDNNDTSGWSGVIFEGSSGAVYGTPTLSINAEIPAGCTLTIDSGKCLTIAGDVTLKNGGAIVVDGNLLNNGTILGGTIDAATGSVTNNGTMPLYLLSQPTAAAPQINLSDPDTNVSVKWQMQVPATYEVTSSGNLAWQGTGNDGEYQSTNKGQDSTTSTLTLSYTVGENGKLELRYKVSCESGYDKLSVIVKNSGGTEVGSAKDKSGEVDWTGLSLTGLIPGTYTVTATYSKDSSQSSGDDCAWLQIPDIWVTIPDAEGLTLPVAAAMAAGTNLVRGVVTHSGGTVTSRPFQPAGIVTLTYNYQGADSGNTQTEKQCYINTSAGELPAPGKTGYLFLGWFKAASGGDKVTAETVVTGNMTIYAQWTEATYTLNVTAPTFDTVTYGYSQPDTKAITIENTGNSDTTITRVALSGAGANAFTLNKTDGTTISTGATDSTTYTVQPNAGLDAGTYTATITVTYNGGATATATLEWKIDKATPNADLFDFAAPQNLVYDGNAKTATVQTKSGVTGMGGITVKYYDAQGNEVTPVDAGTYTVKINVTEGNNYGAQTGITDPDWTFAITKSGSEVTPDTGNVTTAPYGGMLVLKVNVAAVSTFAVSTPAINTVDFYYGTTKLGTANVDYSSGVFGTATLNYDTKLGGVPAGTHEVKAYFGGSENLDPDMEIDTISVTVNKIKATLSWSDLDADALVYDGQANVLTATATGLEGDTLGVNLTLNGDNINVGSFTYTATELTGEKAGFYELPAEKSKTETITARPLTVTPDSDKTKVYGASDPELTYTFTGNVTGEEPGFTGKLTHAGVNAGQYEITKGTLALADNDSFKADNYNLTVTAGVMFTITQATPAAVEAPTASAITYEQTLSASTLSGSGWVWAEPNTVPTVTNSGYTAYYAIADDVNYDWTGVEGYNATNHRLERTVSLSVSKKEVTVPTIASKVYNGQNQTADVSTSTYYAVTTNAGGISVGKYDVVLTLNDANNYKWSNGAETAAITLQFEITKSGSVVGGNHATATYGEKITLSVNVTLPPVSTFSLYPAENQVSFYCGETPLGTVDVVNGTATLEYDTTKGGIPTGSQQTVTVYYGGSADLEQAVGSLTATVNKANAVITVDTTPIVKTYGENWTLPVATSNFGTPVANLTVVQMSNAGNYTLTYTVTGTDNYNGDTESISVTINPAKVEKPDADSTTYTYTGEEQTYPVAENVLYEVSGNKRTDAGSQTVTVSLKDKTNYTWTDGSTDDVTFTFTIGQKDISDAEITLGDALTYNGNEQTQAVASVVIDKLAVTYDVSGNTATNVGTSDYTLTVTGTGNFKGTATKAWNIAKATPVLTITPSDTSLSGGGKVELTITGVPAEGTYEITCNPTISVNADGSYTLPNETEVYTFTVSYTESSNYTAATATCTVSVTKYTYIAPMPNYYTLTFDTNGGTTISSITRVSGTTIDLTDYTTTREGFTFTGWYADEWLTEEVTSVKLRKDTTVYAGWEKIEEPVVNPFKDVFESDWYYEDVMYVYEKDLMQGTATDMFSPAVTTTRGMIVTILYRLEGEPSTAGLDNPFTDLTQNWYIDAVKWAAENDIVAGYGNGKYGPEDPLTREQMVTILWRYAKYKGVDVSSGEDTNILSYNDVFDVSEYAIPAMQWAVTEGVIQGDQGFLTPKASAPRCQIAAILHRYCLLIEEE